MRVLSIKTPNRSRLPGALPSLRLLGQAGTPRAASLQEGGR